MFISIIFNEEYFDISSRSKFYLKNLQHCYENKWVIVTHDYMRKNFDKLQSELDERFFREFEMRHFNHEEVKDVEQYFIPDSFFDELEIKCGSRTEMLTFLTNQRCLQLEEYLQNIIAEIKEKHPDERIEGVLNCLESWESVRYICRRNDLPLISYVFSSVRKPHGYQQTLYSANFDRLYCSDECEIRYNNFKAENIKLPILSNESILALIGKYRNLPLIKHLNDKPVKEINICGEGFLIIPHIYERAKYNDEDIYYECNKLYKYSELGNRQHPIHLNSLQIDRSEIHNDPAAWILGAKRLTAVCSQIVLKAMLWNRTPVMKKNTLPFSFMCSKDYKAEEKTPIDFVNYYLFGYLIPADLMFDKSYWKWRMTKPTESEIYIRHLNYICNILSVDFDRLTSESIDSQFDMIMCSRKCDAQLLEYLNKKTEKKLIDYRVALCRFNVGGLNYWRINELTDGGYISVLKLDSFNGEKVEFYPLDDIAGFVALKTVEVNGTIVYDEEKSSFIYCKKNEGHFDIQQIPLGGKIQIKCIWKYQTIQENITAK